LRVLGSLDKDIEYLKADKNLGFGKAHNMAMRKTLDHAKYHLVLNPDIYFGSNVLETLFDYMEQHPDVGQVMPKVHYPDGEIQRLCKLSPAPADLAFRRFLPWIPGAKKRNSQYELIESGYDKIMNVPFLSGCFMLFRTKALKNVGLFDERIFMYLEDADITRRMHRKYKTIFMPDVTVFHHYAKGSYKSLKLMAYNIHGAIIYFNKYGWLFDSERSKVNRATIDSYLREK